MTRLEMMWSAIPPWLRAAVVGGLVGAAIGTASVVRVRAERLPGNEPPFGYGDQAAFGVTAGIAGGIIYWATGPLRRRGSWRFFSAWVLIGMIGLGVALAPGFVTEPSIALLVLWVVGGIGGGLGMAITERQVRK